MVVTTRGAPGMTRARTAWRGEEGRGTGSSPRNVGEMLIIVLREVRALNESCKIYSAEPSKDKGGDDQQVTLISKQKSPCPYLSLD